MLGIEDYIARRKKEDNLNEFELDARAENIKLCIDYVFEYFNNYLNTTQAEEKTVLHNEKIDKYRRQLNDYEPEVRDWLVSIYYEYGKQMTRTIGHVLKQNEFFLLFSSDSEFRGVSYDCYSQLIKKCPFLKDQTDMLFLFIKDYHRVQSHIRLKYDVPFISDSINDWIENTLVKCQVNVAAFSWEWVNYFNENEDLWPSSHRRKSQYTWRKYEYDYMQKSNLFNLDSLYRKMPKKPYTRGKKQEFEILMMYYWLHDFEGDEDGYWQDYLNKVLPSMNQ